ncbi:cytochrome c551 peroxidase [Sulfurimonas gotlandica GD1]|uniref:Cytochrome c551 peroxidase n=1 Tax=Sulfurimonas gotlandica (strain DSM 19862 / JCM 16533 / GD1) TaxID=929558 RepID=H1FRT3_SULGG|nr:cytochrome-c peroxidase [Sulfurimonas gotlandica]EHP29819.1 cytochrome c551 peroxidase [Sulfurimonas gotlandica GD1]
MLKLLIIHILCTVIFAIDDITPIPLSIEYDKQKAELGKKIFFDPIISKDGTISCSTCHNLPGGGANNTPYSFGVDSQEGIINSPTVLNAVFNFAQFWDGRERNLKDQSRGPITNSLEMATTMEDALNKLNNSSYKKEFFQIYRTRATEENLMEVIAEFEKALITPNSRFDKYLRGDRKALNEQEKRGYESFKSVGCISCHNGVNIGGNMYQKLGVILPYKQDKPSNGRYDITKRERDRNVFKVPTLRNIELTAPYFHDGRVKTLKDAIFEMREHQLGLESDKENLDDIEAFLRTLTGEMPSILNEKKQ